LKPPTGAKWQSYGDYPRAARKPDMHSIDTGVAKGLAKFEIKSHKEERTQLLSKLSP
jgi:hypothetical protein